MQEWDIRARLKRIETKIDAQSALLIEMFATITGANVPDDLLLKLTGESMAKTNKLAMVPVGSKRMAMPGVKWSTLAANLQLVPIGADGNPIPSFDPTKESVVLSVDNTSLVTVTPGADPLHDTLTRLAGALGNVVLTAVLASTETPPAFSPITSTLPIELDPPPPPQPTDLLIEITGN